MKRWRQTFIPGLLALWLLSGCATVPHTGRSQLILLSDAEVAQMGLTSYRRIMRQSPVVTGQPDSRRVRYVGRKVSEAAERFLRENGYADRLPYFKWEFSLIRGDETINAWCLPGGKIAFYTGILPYAGNDNGIAVIMGHEIAHAIANHGNERMSQLLLAQLGGMALATALEEEPETTQVLALAAYGLGSQIGILLPYSRTQEYEADRIGLILTAMAGFDPREAVPLWRRMMAAGGESPPEFLSTHPATEARIREIQDFLPEALRYRPTP